MIFNCIINSKENVNDGNFYKKIFGLNNLIKEFNTLKISDDKNLKENNEKNSIVQNKFSKEIYYSASSYLSLKSEIKNINN